MTKVYLVMGKQCNKLGLIKPDGLNIIDRVFTNKKLAYECAKWLNEDWVNSLGENQEKQFYYYVETKTISKCNFKELPF